jgi:hypothetical protein
MSTAADRTVWKRGSSGARFGQAVHVRLGHVPDDFPYARFLAHGAHDLGGSNPLWGIVLPGAVIRDSEVLKRLKEV